MLINLLIRQQGSTLLSPLGSGSLPLRIGERAAFAGQRIVQFRRHRRGAKPGTGGVAVQRAKGAASSIACCSDSNTADSGKEKHEEKA